MWLSIWNVTVSILFECWLMIEESWEAIRFYFSQDDQREVRRWLRDFLPRVPHDFAESWRDGLLLSTLLNKLQPGCCPGADSLDPSYGLRNLYHVFQVLEYHFNITPKFTVEEVITCSSGSDSKLLELLLQLKKEADTRIDEVEPAAHAEESKDKLCESSSSTNCVARGTGLMVGFVGRAANFIVFFESLSDLDLVVEIKGPCDTMCTERVTKRSPKKKQTTQPWTPTSVYEIVRSSSNEDKKLCHSKNHASTSKKENETRYMPLEYEVHSNRIYFAYMPLVKGQHKIKVLSQGMHVSDSPYTVSVGSVVETHKKADPICLKAAMKFDPEDTETRKTGGRFHPRERMERMGKVIKRRVLRYIVKIDNKDIVVDTDSINNLATSLLKMDYEFQKPPLNRRNSWGFVGDAERKVSVIRQFCVNLDDLEAQSARLHRSHSFSSNSKKVLNRGTSYECEDIVEQRRLETVTEGTVSDFESTSVRNSEELVYLNGDFENDSKPSESNNEGCHVDNASGPELKRNCMNGFMEDIPKNDNVFEDRMTAYSNFETTSNFSEAEAERFIRKDGIDKLPDHLTSASDISGSIEEQTNYNEAMYPIQSTTLTDTKIKTARTKDTLHDVVRDGKCYNEEDSNSIRRSKVLTENSVSNSVIDYNAKTIPKQNDSFIPVELDITNETFIEEEPFTKTDISTLKNKIYQKSDSFPTPSLGDEDGSTKANGIILDSNTTHSHNISPEDSCLETQLEHSSKSKTNEEYKGSLKWKNKRTTFPSIKTFRNRQKHLYQRHKIKMNSPSSSNTPNRSLNVKSECNNKFNQSKCAMPNIKIENASSFDRNNIWTKNFERNSFVYDLKDFQSGKSKKVSEENHASFLVNNLKENNKPYPSSNEITGGRKNKMATKFSARMDPKYEEHSSKNCYTEISINNKYSLSSSISDESGVQITPPIQTSRLIFDPSYDNSRPVKSYTLVGLGQLNFRHFNPTTPNTKSSLVKNRIQQWEKTVEKDLATQAKLKSQEQSQRGEITSKLKFWENATKKKKLKEELLNGLRTITDSCNDGEEDGTSTEQISVTGMGIENHKCNQGNAKTPTINRKDYMKPDLDKTLIVTRMKLSDGHSSETHPFPKTRRSASDPGVLEQSTQEARHHRNQQSPKPDRYHSIPTSDHQASSQESVVHEMAKTSSVEYPSSQSFLDTDDEGDSSADDLMDSSEDEYIDDEISESASTYWGDLSVMERLKVADNNEYRDLCQIVDEDFWRYGKDCVPASPVECQVFGIATYFGYVAVKNRFQVLTKGAGSGNLSATLQGFGHHDVTYVSVRYTRKDIYEVTYQVMSPGLYLISVRWMENPIVGSPFLCKVTF